VCSVQTLEIIHWNLYGNQAIISEASLITSLHLTNILLSTIINQVSAEKLNQILNTSTKIATIFLYIFLPWRYNLSVNTNNQWNSKLFVQQTMSAGKQLIVKTFVQWIEALFQAFFFRQGGMMVLFLVNVQGVWSCRCLFEQGQTKAHAIMIC